MADLGAKISELPAASGGGDSDLLALVQDGTTKKISLGDLKHDMLGVTRGVIGLSAAWNGASSPFTQTVEVAGGTVSAAGRVDLQPTPAQIAALQAGGVTALLIENNNGVLTAYALGAHPATAMTVQCTVTEVRQV